MVCAWELIGSLVLVGWILLELDLNELMKILELDTININIPMKRISWLDTHWPIVLGNLSRGSALVQDVQDKAWIHGKYTHFKFDK